MVMVALQNAGPADVGVLVGVLVEVAVAVEVAEAVGVSVGVDVAVEVKVCVGVAEAVGVWVNVGMAPPVEVEVGVWVEAMMDVDVKVGLGLGVEDAGGKDINVFVGVDQTQGVFVGDTAAVVDMDGVVTSVPVTGIVEARPVVGVSRVAVGNEAPGVRKPLLQAGFVRMAESTGSMNPSGLCVRKSLFGSSLDSTLASSSQLGAKRNAHPAATRIHTSPKMRMKAMTLRSRFSFSITLMGKSIKRQAHIDCGAWTELFVMTGALQPDAPMMCVDDAARDGKSQPGSSALKFGFAR